MGGPPPREAVGGPAGKEAAVEEFSTILLTTDFSDTSRRAFGPALTLARKFGAKLLVVYVEEDRLPPMVIEYMAVGMDDLMDQQRTRADERLKEFVRTHLGEHADVEAVVAMGTPHVEIVRLAEERKADLIVIATHGRGFISHAIMGSTSERVLRRASCPVMVVREPPPC
jgi:nucleotide-binding universal stress UspA family protein